MIDGRVDWIIVWIADDLACSMEAVGFFREQSKLDPDTHYFALRGHSL